MNRCEVVNHLQCEDFVPAIGRNARHGFHGNRERERVLKTDPDLWFLGKGMR
jgi:hypothetical protein